VKLAKGKPVALKKVPDMVSPLFGQIRFGSKTYFIAVDEPATKDAKLYVDANGNGDLTDDPEPKWEKKTGDGPNGVQLTQYSGKFELPLGAGDKAENVSFGAYRFDPNDTRRAQFKSTFLYYSDYAYEGDVTLNGAKYKAMLVDMSASGRTAGAAAATEGAGDDADAKPAAAAAGGANGLRLYVDINGDGEFAQRGEIFEADKPFNVKGTTWQVAFPGGPDGAPFKIAKSGRAVAEIPLPPNHSVGATITPFKARRLDGKAVSFPADFKGHVVLLDFWATWCPPCREEIPGLVATYKSLRPRGFEVLGISLDQANQANTVKGFMTDQGMTWPQVYDGKFWKAAVAELYGIHSIPTAFLVDGDTGKVLAVGGSLRGDALEQTVTKALDKKFNGNGTTADANTAKAEEKAAEPSEQAPEVKPEPKPAAPEPKEEKKEALPF
jgi:thiol-disulfide isomerase/thioredoxin